MPGSLTSGFLWSRWTGKRSRRMRNYKFYASGERPMLKECGVLPAWWLLAPCLIVTIKSVFHQNPGTFGWLRVASHTFRVRYHLDIIGWLSSWRMTYGPCNMSSGFHMVLLHVIRMTYIPALKPSEWDSRFKNSQIALPCYRPYKRFGN